ncbi:glycosyl hydrolase family 71-domain-containing protein [Mycena amicta]|nr:glycosyl hydrolase family 71-domain-containing protein [Mycena amicta]
MRSTRILPLLTACLAATLVQSAVLDPVADVEARQTGLAKLVFSHFMIGIESDRNSASDYDADMQRAKAYGIDAFALNIGVDPYTDTQLSFAYQSAANNGMKVFISFDFNWYNTGQSVAVGQKIAQYGNLPAQLKINNAVSLISSSPLTSSSLQVFASSFAGDGLDVPGMKAAAASAGGGMSVFFVPNFHPTQSNFQTSGIDGALNWLGWDNNGNNKAPDGSGNVTVLQGDQQYLAALAGKPYLAPASAWFSTHYGPEVSYSKNWIFPSDLLWYNRWNQLLTLGQQWIEIVTWNDYGESHYVGPLSSKHQDDGGSKWVNDMPHNAWLDMAKPYIAAWKAGATSVNNFITSDQIIYWYRPTLRTINCDATDTCEVPASNSSGNYFLGRPNGWETMSDSIFVVTLLTQPGTLTVNSGPTSFTFNAPAGAQSFSVPMSVGQQSFALSRNGVNALAGVSLKNVVDSCICGLYNFNAFTGAVPPTFVDPLGPDGLVSLTLGLHVATCANQPSLATSAPPYTGGGGQGTTTPPVSSTTTTTSSPITSPPTTTTTTSTTTSATQTCGVGCTITASSQIFPTNCLQAGCVWQGPAGQGTPDHCDTGGKPTCTT